MAAAVLTAPRRIVHQRVEAPEPGPDLLIARVVHTGVCGSDVATYQGVHPYKRPPAVLGHEFAGIVERVGERVTGFAPGQPVCSAAFFPCGRCDPCRRDVVNLCQDRRNLSHRGWSGTFAQWVALDPVATFRIPPGVGLAAAALTEPLSIGLHAVRRVPEDAPRRDAVIIGAGSIGLACLIGAKRSGFEEVACVDLGPDKGRLSRALGADHYVDAASEPIAAGAGDPPPQADVTFVATGYPGVLDDACATTRPGGVVIVVSYFAGPHTVDLNACMAREIDVAFSTLSCPEDFHTVLDWLGDGRVDPEPMVTHRFPLREAAAAFALIEESPRSVGKVLLDVDQHEEAPPRGEA